jgi:nitrile hydratase
MNGAQDLGGQHGFGPIRPESGDVMFHADWERRVLALTVAMGGTGAWNLDMSRHARERMAPADYLASTYYEIWYHGLTRLLVETGLATPDEIAGGRSGAPGKDLPRKPTAETMPAALATGSPVDREVEQPSRFAAGDRVRARVMNPKGHTRLPRYARGRTGTVARVHGAHVFPDAHAHGLGEDPQWLYSVSFASTELWGEDGKDGDEVRIDLWEPYLEPA